VSKVDYSTFIQHQLDELTNLYNQAFVAQAMLRDVQSQLADLEALVRDVQELSDKSDEAMRRIANRWFESGSISYDRWVELL